MRTLKAIIIHCSDTPFGKDFRASDIDAWHKQRGFACIGYHFVVRLDGSIDIGRDLSLVGAHCLGHNACSIGICYIGGRDADGKPADTRTPAQKESLLKLVDMLMCIYPHLSVYGHNEFSDKACPCFDVQSENWRI